MSKNNVCLLGVTALINLLGIMPVWATEGGGSTYAHGTENAFVGFMPSPGFYGLVYASHDHLSKLRDDKGDEIELPFDVKANVIAPRAVWVTDTKLLNGQLAWHAVLPLVSLDSHIAGYSEKHQGLGDLVIGSGLGYHPSEKVHYAFGLDITAPTGTYKQDNLVNLGRNYWNIQPAFALSYIQASGLNADLKLMYGINFKNSDTNYRSGQELHMDYALGYALNNGWTAGIGGYLYQQTTDDKQDSTVRSNSKGRAFAVGPSISYHNNSGFLVSVKWQQDYGVRNRAEGNAVKIKLAIPF